MTTMTDSQIPAKTQYDSFAPVYLSVDDLPLSKVEASLVLTALGDCTGLHILDLGGGNGLHARRAVSQANAASVDVVDISREMLRIGADIELSKSTETTDTPSRIRWFEADLSRSLSSQTIIALRSAIDVAWSKSQLAITMS